MSKEWKCPFCGGKATWFDRKTITYLPDSKTRCGRCGRTDELKELILSESNGDNLNRLVSNLDGSLIGRMGINKCTACGDVWLTVYDAAENGKGFGDEQLSFCPAELLAFCREVIRIANLQPSNNK